jgi:hypothetical protein
MLRFLLMSVGFTVFYIGGLVLVVSAPYTWSGKWRWKLPWS